MGDAEFREGHNKARRVCYGTGGMGHFRRPVRSGTTNGTVTHLCTRHQSQPGMRHRGWLCSCALRLRRPHSRAHITDMKNLGNPRGSPDPARPRQGREDREKETGATFEHAVVNRTPCQIALGSTSLTSSCRITDPRTVSRGTPQKAQGEPSQAAAGSPEDSRGAERGSETCDSSGCGCTWASRGRSQSVDGGSAWEVESSGRREV